MFIGALYFAKRAFAFLETLLLCTLANRAQRQVKFILFMISLRVLILATTLVLLCADFCERRLPNNNTSLFLQNCQTFHQVYVNVGTPAMAFPFLVDTGSLMSWIPTTGCNCGKGLDPFVSRTCKITRKTHNIKYADGDSIFGFQGSQRFTISNTSLKGVQFTLVLVTKKTAPKIGDRGILALGYDAMNIFDAAYEQGIIGTSAFVLDFSANSGGSKIIFDKIPKRIVNESVYAPIMTNTHLWAVQCKGVRVNGIDYSNYASKTLLIDSGTTITSLNTEFYKQLILTSFRDCETNDLIEGLGLLCPLEMLLPKIEIKIGENIVYLDPKYYSKNAGNMVQVFLVPSPNMILGSSFFKNYAITFDKRNSKIGFYGPSSKNWLKS